MGSAILAQTTNTAVEAKSRFPVDHNFYEQEPVQTMNQYDSSNWITFAFGSIGRQKIIKKNHKRAVQESETVYHPPAWISSMAWQCMYIKDLSSLRWEIKIQTCRTLDGNTAFFNFVDSGDILNVQKMLRERTGFVNDRFYGSSTSLHFHNLTQKWVGATPLHVSLQKFSEYLIYFHASNSLQIAAYNGDHNLCKLLLSANADVSARDYCTG